MYADRQVQALEHFLRHIGFAFNPFQHLEATSDPHIGEYLVGLESFAVAWDPCPALVFAPTGGGKTAMRVYTIQSSWLGLGGSHAFPVSCLLRPSASSTVFLPDDEGIYRFLLSSAAIDLFLGIAFRPQRFFELGTTDAAMLVSIWRYTLTRRFERALMRLEDTGDPSQLVSSMDPAYRIKRTPEGTHVAAFCDAVRQHDRAGYRFVPRLFWDRLVDLVLGPLNFSAMFLLFDGLDALPESHNDRRKGLQWFRCFWSRASEWATKHVYVKGFLPTEFLDSWQNVAPQEIQGQRIGSLPWTHSLLADMLRRRVMVATDGRAGSLDAFSNPDLRDVETELARMAPPAPREVLVLTQMVLQAWWRRAQDPTSMPGSSASVRLGRQDVERAYQAYEREQRLRTWTLDRVPSA